MARAAAGRLSGFTLVEVVIAAVILAVAITGISGSILSSMTLNRVNRESGLAQQAARRVMEQLMVVPFNEVFACYNDDPSDDGGLSVGPFGPNFTVPGLDPQPGDADGFCGRIEFPSVTVGGDAQLREDVVDAALGVPRDLNGDGAIDSVDHDTNAILIPARVTVAWRGVNGDRQIALETMLCLR